MFKEYYFFTKINALIYVQNWIAVAYSLNISNTKKSVVLEKSRFFGDILIEYCVYVLKFVWGIILLVSIIFSLKWQSVKTLSDNRCVPSFSSLSICSIMHFG